ncbi:hypothetical protein XH93_21605 [Bradyrhizobium sp. CCBAU 51753]|nr:hypothetical protein XH93_21605 [Bradyrhizobium sp. CCBAU 51753]
MSSGEKFTLLKVMLYDEEGVQEVAKLRAQAAKSLGGGSLGVGVLGSPSWTLLGEAAALSIVSALLSGASQKQAAEVLRAAQIKSEAVAKSGTLFDFAQVKNNHSPHPTIWYVDGLRRRHVHDGDEFVTTETNTGAMSVRWSQVAAYFSPQQPPDGVIVSAHTNFIQPKPVPWAKATVPSMPSVYDSEAFPVGTTIYDAAGVRLAVLPNHSVLVVGADRSYPSVEAYRNEEKDRSRWDVITRY